MTVFDLVYSFIIGMAIYLIIMQMAERRIVFKNYTRWRKVTLRLDGQTFIDTGKVANLASVLNLMLVELNDRSIVLKEKPNLSSQGMVYVIEFDEQAHEVTLYYHNTIVGKGNSCKAMNLALHLEARQ